MRVLVVTVPLPKPGRPNTMAPLARQIESLRKLGVEVHRALLEKSDNFWLSSWLDNQVKLLQA